MQLDWLNAQNPVLIYIGDPMCSWCYGFAPEITELKEKLPQYEFKLIVGGLRPGGTETMAELGEFLSHHWQEVAERSGMPFNHGIIGDSSFVLDTEPGCRAVVAAREMDASIELPFFKAVQHAFFVENKDMRDPDTFTEIAKNFGLDTNEYRKKFESEETRYSTRADFQLAAEMGVRGFPSVVLRHNGQLYLVANGYRKTEDLSKTIENIEKAK